MVLQGSSYVCPIATNVVALPLPPRQLFTTQDYYHTTDTKCKLFHEFLLLEMKETCMVLFIFASVILVYEVVVKP